MSEDVGILVFIGGAFLIIVLIIVVGARFASRGRPATGPVRHREVDDDDLGSWRRSSAMDSTPYVAAGAMAALDGDLTAGEDRDGDGRPDDDRNEASSSDDSGWDSSDSSSDSSDSGGGDSSD